MVDQINSALSFETDVTDAKPLVVNAASKACYQGQTHGHKGFLLTRSHAERLVEDEPPYAEVLFPYLTGDELLGERDSLPKRYVIDFGTRDMLEAKGYPKCFELVENAVLRSRKERADAEEERNVEALADDEDGRVTRDHASALSKWWQLFRHRGEMLRAIEIGSLYRLRSSHETPHLRVCFVSHTPERRANGVSSPGRLLVWNPPVWAALGLVHRAVLYAQSGLSVHVKHSF